MIIMKIFLLLAFISFPIWAGENTYSKASAFRAPTKREKILVLNNPQKMSPYFDRSINVLVWNIFLGQKKNWPQKYKEILKQRDLVLLQEFYLTDIVKKEFQDDLKRQYILSSAYIYKKDNLPAGVATASSVSSIQRKNLYSKHKEPITAVYKSSLFTTYKLKNGKKLLVVNVHGLNFVLDHILGDQILEIEKEIKKHKGPVILAGDFNTFTYGKIKYLNMVAKNLNLLEVEYPTDRRKKFMKYPLDHVYYRELKVKQTDVLPSLEGSDHNAISVIFDII